MTRRSLPLLLGVAAASVGLDQWSKHWATTHLAYAPPVHVLDGLVRLTYTRNSGIAFGLFAGHSYPFYVFSIVAAVAVFWLYHRHPHLPLARQLSLALILGGAIGNLIDRIAAGEVVDFILLAWGRHEFPVFNVADVCVTAGVLLFALAWSHEDGAEAAEPGAEAAPADAPGADAPPADAPGANAPAAPEPAMAASPEGSAHDAHAGADGPAAGRGPAGGPLAGQGADRPLP